jgi:hypothetical protein
VIECNTEKHTKEGLQKIGRKIERQKADRHTGRERER